VQASSRIWALYVSPSFHLPKRYNLPISPVEDLSIRSRLAIDCNERRPVSGVQSEDQVRPLEHGDKVHLGHRVEILKSGEVAITPRAG
jgi:hypothetical protein